MPTPIKHPPHDAHTYHLSKAVARYGAREYDLGHMPNTFDYDRICQCIRMAIPNRVQLILTHVPRKCIGSREMQFVIPESLVVHSPDWAIEARYVKDQPIANP